MLQLILCHYADVTRRSLQFSALDSEKYGHCGAVTRDDQWLVITGGENSYKTVEIFHLDNFETHFVEVKLNHQRSQHSCLTYSDEGSQGFIVAGKS